MYSVASSSLVAQPAPPPPALSPSLTSSPASSRRLRGLSLLRTYTQMHILSRESQHSSNSSISTSSSTSSSSSSIRRPSISPSTSYTASTTAPAGSTVTATLNPPPTSPKPQRSPVEIASPEPHSNVTETLHSTSPTSTVVGQSSRSPSPPQAQPTTPPSASPPTVEPESTASASMARTRSATSEQTPEMPQSEVRAEQPAQNGGASATNGMAHQLPSIRFIAHQDPRANRPSLSFSPMARVLPTGGEIIKVGRYSERDAQPVQASNVPSAAPVGFKSKVVSRRHCEFWCQNGRWYIKDVKSSSGTFLNHIRLSSPGTESKPYPVNDGDIVQLGIDFKGGEEMIFRCVKIRVELNKGWQTGPSSFNVQSHKRLRELSGQTKSSGGSSQDCSICLGPIAPCQSLFVAPCSHTWHYKCIRVIINGPHWPHFVCPNCRSVADLEAELEDPFANAENAEWEQIKATDASPATEESGVVVEPAHNESAENLVPVEAVEENALEAEENERSEELRPASGSRPDVDSVAEDLEYMHIDEAPSPSSSTGSGPDPISNATVSPVDIHRPRGAHLERPNHRMSERSPSRSPSRNFSRPRVASNTPPRTPSPNAIPSSLNGPMTPRNDVGPFVFDGGAGLAVPMIPAEHAEAPRSTPQPELVHAS